jgi:hypothetical protein
MSVSQKIGISPKNIQALFAKLQALFAKLRKATISFVMTVRLSVRPHGTTQLSPDGFL